jgi:peroxiredoxin
MTNFNSRPALLSLAAILLVALSAEAAEPGAVRAPIQRVQDRKPAPDFRLEDAAGKIVRLSNYRGKVVLLDFWATECGGCVREIPWFIDLARAYRKKGLAVTGVSVDILYEDLKDSQEAWRRVKPFVQAHQVNYPVLMGDDRVTKPYDIQALPATYLIDKRGRIAATYIGLVDKENLEANIQAVLKEHGRQ